MKIAKRRRRTKAGSLVCRQWAGGISIGTSNLLVGLALLFASGPLVAGQQPGTPADVQQPAAPPGSVKLVLGLANIKPNAKGDLTIQAGALHFKTSKGEAEAEAEAEVSIASIQDVFTGQDFKQLIGGTVGTLAKMGVPYGGGRVLSLFQEKIDVLTVEYRDANGGLHGAIFTLPKGQALPVKQELVAAAAHSSTPLEQSAMPEASAQTAKPVAKLSASAIQIEPVEMGEVKMPPEFRAAVYENLIATVTKSRIFPHVYRSGDRAAGDAPDLVIVRMKVVGFKHGSQRTREVTTVAGATTVALGVQVSSRDGKILVDREVEGKVRFFGGNLRATNDFSKKVTALLRQSF